MKRFIIFLLALPALLLPMSLWGANNKTVVVFFSCTNNTKNIADKIVSVLECDQWRIVPEEPYTSADLNYNSDCRANREQNDPTARPAISGTTDLSQYEVVYVGFPIWWGKMPKIMWTFFEAYDLEGKTIIPFCTSGSSGISSAMSEIRGLEPNATVKEGQRFSGSASEAAVRTWVESVQPETTEDEPESTKIAITVGSRKLTASLADNTASQELAALLKDGSISVDMHDYGGFEKVGSLPQSFTRSDEQLTAGPCDIMLYQGNQMVIFYGSNSWAYTRLGKIENMTGDDLKQALGTGNITVTLALDAPEESESTEESGKTDTVTIHDTVTVTVHDTVEVIKEVVRVDTVKVYDTVEVVRIETVTVHDTVYINDTIWNTDTLTVVVHDTVILDPNEPVSVTGAKGLSGVNIYPNPTSGFFHVTVPERGTVEVFDASGKRLQKREAAVGVQTFRMENSGVYFVRVRSVNGGSATQRLIVK